MKTVAAVLIVIRVQAFSQADPGVWPGGALPVDVDSLTAEQSFLFVPERDSLERSLASLEISKAAAEVASTDFWHRLIPRCSIDAGIGVRDVAFRDASGVLVFPKDSYRLTIGLSISGLIEGSLHSQAELHLAEAGIRFSLLQRRQLAARGALVRKRSEVLAELEALREEIPLRESDLACRELLFAQGHADFQALTAARIDLIRLRRDSGRLEAMARTIGKALAGDPGP